MTRPTGFQLLTDKARIEAFLRRNPELHIYALGDLDDFFWPRTTWYGWQERGELRDVVLMYAGPGLPTILGISAQPDRMCERLREVITLLPQRFYTHLSPGVECAFGPAYRLDSHGLYYKMALRGASRVSAIDCRQVIPLKHQNAGDLTQLYEEGYPGNWFDLQMLETGQYFGLRADGRLVSAAGVHVYSERYRVAAIGNVVTHPRHRNKGYARLVTAGLCQSLLEKVEHVGLNVRADNEAALACYRQLGFEVVAPYGEFTAVRVCGPG